MKATVVLYKSKTLSNGEHPLMLCLRDRSKIKYYSLGVSLPGKHYNTKKKQWISLSIETIDLIKSAEAKYATKINELATAKKHVSLDTLYEMVEHPIKRDFTVYKWFDSLIEDLRQ